MNAISEQLLIINPANFPPNTGNPSCEDNWRVSKGSCWARYGFVSVDGAVEPEVVQTQTQTIDSLEYQFTEFLWGCNEFCCLERYEVCLDSNGERIITQTGYIPPTQQDCDDLGNTDCFPVCGSVYNR